jgi:hypothetical protein
MCLGRLTDAERAMQDDSVAAAEVLVRAAIVEFLGPEAVPTLEVRIDAYLAPTDGEPLLCVSLAPVGADAAAWRGSAFLRRTALTPERLAWAVYQSTRSAVQQLGLL